MSLCNHVRVTTFRDEDRTVRMWTCEDCRRRFYPACETCVDVGHRNIEHPEGWIAGLTTMDRLAAPPVSDDTEGAG